MLPQACALAHASAGSTEAAPRVVSRRRHIGMERTREDDYGRVLRLSYLFYEGQMSGKLPGWNRLLAGKPGGYKKSAHLTDGSDIGADLSGGYYDAGGAHAAH